MNYRLLRGKKGDENENKWDKKREISREIIKIQKEDSDG